MTVPKTADYNLPGLDVTLNDGGLRITPALSGTKLTILGTTANTILPINEPVVLLDHKQIRSALDHPDGIPSELSLAVAEAVQGGAKNIEIVKIAELSGEDTASYAPEDRFDDLEDALEIIKLTPLDIVYCEGAWVEDIPTGVNANGTTRKGFHYLLADKLYQSNRQGNTAMGVLGVRPLMATAREESWTGAPSDRAGELFDDVSAAYVKEWVDHLVADTGTLMDHSAEGELTGFLYGSVEETAGTVSANYDLWAKEEDGSTAVDNLGNNVDGGALLSIVAMAARVRHPDVERLAVKLGEAGKTDLNTNGAAAYAGLITTLDPEVSTTNQTMNQVSASRPMAAGYAEELVEFRYVTALDRTKGYVVAAGLTAAYNASQYTRSDYVNLTTVRITNAAIDLVRIAAEDFIGGPINAMTMAALSAAINGGLNRLKASGALQEADFSLITTPDMQVLGEAQVDLTLVPAFELRRLRVITSLAKEL
jgi:hypothetical protein